MDTNRLHLLSSLTMKKTLFYSLLFLVLTLDVTGQSHPSLHNYLFNPVAISPSYAGRLSGTISAGHDQRWVGIDGAPVTSDISYDVTIPTAVLEIGPTSLLITLRLYPNRPLVITS